MSMDDDDPTADPGAAPAWLAAWWTDLITALTFLTRIPLSRFVPQYPPESDWAPDLARATRAMPLAGAAIGLFGGAIYWLSTVLGLTPAISGLLAVGATILATGALHEDGLADSADGLFAGAEPARRLEIMRDSRSGAYGVLALVLSVGLRATALAAIAAQGAGPGAAVAALIAAHAVARALPPAVMAWAPLARDDGLAAGAGPAKSEYAWTALGIGAAFAVIFLGLGAGLVALLAAGLIGFAGFRLARARIGGYTGDILGAIEQLGEIAVLLTAVALI